MEKSIATESVKSNGTGSEDRSIRQKFKITPKCTGFLKIHQEYNCPKGSTCVCYTDDLETLAAGKENGDIQLFENGQRGTTLTDYDTNFEEEPCTDIKIKSSPKGGFNKTILASYLSGHIKLWNTALGKTIFTMKENRQTFSLEYHPRSNRFVTCGSDAKVYVYDEEIRVLERVLACSEIVGSTNGHTDYATSAKFHPKNPFELISSGTDNTIQFWDIRAPYAVRNITGVCPYGDGLDLSYDGNTILACDSGKPYNILKTFDYSTEKMLKEFQYAGSFPFCCKFLTSVYAGIGTFYQHSFRIVNLNTLRVVATVTNLPGCVMNFSLHRPVPRFHVEHDNIPRIAFTAAEKVIEIIPTPQMEDYKEKGNFGRGDEL